jgi:hypothetical protein
VSRLQTVTDLNVGDALPESWVDAVRINLAYLSVAGADLTSGSTINITAAFHKVTGTTTINNIVDLSGATKGQPVALHFTGVLTLHHNGGGAGQLFLPGAADKQTVAGDVIQFVYDSSGDQWIMVSEKLVSSMSQLAVDVTMTTGATWYDGPSLALTPGTWLLTAVLTYVANNRVMTGKIYDGGGTVAASVEMGQAGAVQEFVVMTARVVIAATTTWRAALQANGAGCTIKAACVTAGAGNNASTLIAVRAA